MSLALTREDFERLFVAPPAHDWTAAFSAVQNLKDLEKIAGQFEAETRRWLTSLQSNFDAAMAEIKKRSEGVPEDVVRRALLPVFQGAIDLCEEAIAAHDQPFHEDHSATEVFEKLKAVSGPAGRFLRKQINRIEAVRVLRHNSLVDFYYGLLAVRSELEEASDDDQSFEDPESLREFLIQHVA